MYTKKKNNSNAASAVGKIIAISQFSSHIYVYVVNIKGQTKKSSLGNGGKKREFEAFSSWQAWNKNILYFHYVSSSAFENHFSHSFFI